MAIREELQIIRNANNGTLKPGTVVNWAKSNPGSELHKRFDWNNDTAAQKYRLQQARQLIRIVVEISEDTGSRMNTYVSLSTDRLKGVGYRAMVDVVNSPTQLQQLVLDAQKELATFKFKYQELRELAEFYGVFEAIDNLDRKTKTVAQAAA